MKVISVTLAQPELQSLFIKILSKAGAKNNKKHINIYFLICIFSMSASFVEASGEALYGTASSPQQDHRVLWVVSLKNTNDTRRKTSIYW